ncbi:MAG: pentapeptide repeat-containing protein, partial [Rivularia sp. (in: cyanobacteria)]
ERLSDVQAEELLDKVANSSFVQQINKITLSWLVANSVPKLEAELIIRCLEHKLLGNLIVVVSENATELVQLQKFFGLGNSVKLRTTEIHWKSDDKIDLKREKYRASLIKKLGEPLSIESFCLKDIYVPPTGLALNENHQTVDLMKWVVSQLEDLETITVIESDSGYGKTSFCQIFAARVARKFYPDWIPVLISLNEIKWGDNFQETLESTFIKNYRISLSAWLEEPKNKCLLILDGLNELPNSAENKTVFALFMQQLFEFQSQFGHRFKHKIILTTQSWALEDIVAKAASKLQRIKIQAWGQNEWKLWFASWAKVQSNGVAQNYFTLLKKNKAFSQKSQFPLSHLVRQPLMLYLIGILHREELLDNEILQLATNNYTNNVVILWAIYQRLNQWLFGYRVSGAISPHIHYTSEAAVLIKNRHPQELIDEMEAVALQILFSGNKKINLTNDFSTLNAFYFKTTKNSEKVINSTPSTPSPPSTIEFSHSKFGEYLCAASIVSKLKALTKRDRNAYGEMIFLLDSPSSIAEHLYDLFGYGILTQEIEELVIEGLRQEKKHKFSFELLCDRLGAFWYPYSRGRWLDEGIAHKAWFNFKQLQNPVNVEQVNAAVGINVFLLLSACYREIKVTFSPCFNPASTELHPQTLTKLIAKTAVFHPGIIRRIGEKSLASLNLSKADLTQAMLGGVNLANTDLSNAQLKDACLAGANLANVNLTGADLTGANLINANLTSAKLTGANLTGANLLGVNLDLVNLSNACLFQAIIAEAHKEIAYSNGAVFTLDKFEELQRLLSYQSHIGDTNTGEKTE